jgi:hypothetical protein
MVQLPEKMEEKSDAYKAGYKTIAEIQKNVSVVQVKKF